MHICDMLTSASTLRSARAAATAAEWRLSGSGKPVPNVLLWVESCRQLRSDADPIAVIGSPLPACGNRTSIHVRSTTGILDMSLHQRRSCRTDVFRLTAKRPARR